MKTARVRLRASCLVFSVATAPVSAQVFSSEFFSDPVSEGWERLIYYCEPKTWNDRGWYHQQLDLDACPPGPGGGRDTYRRSLEAFNGAAQFFLEFRLETDGDQSEIPGVAPTVVAMGNSFGVIYHVTVARDLVRFIAHFDLPGLFIEIEAGVPHSYRVELYRDRYAFYIDGHVIDQGAPDGPFPAHDSDVPWQGESWYLPCHNAWDYIRYGVIPVDGSGDFDSDGVVGLGDFYFVHECLSNRRLGINGGPDQDAGPGCRFADFDSDSDTDLRDFAEFQNTFAQTP